MKVVYQRARGHDPSEIECDDFSELENGIQLYDKDGDGEVVGYVPYEQLQYVLPDDAHED